MNEFAIIDHFFKRTLLRNDVVLGIGDDAAIVAPPINTELLITTDTLIENVHFPEHTLPFDLGWKALAVNLSDLAAMGATPAWITLALTIPNADSTWLQQFSNGFFSLADKHAVALIGGDLTRGPLSVTIQAMGYCEKHRALRRTGAKAGDKIYVTRHLGDAALALACSQNKKTLPTQHYETILPALTRPIPQIALGQQLLGLATAAIDISDGLAADLHHILTASHVGAVLQAEAIPLSKTLRDNVSLQEAREYALFGGDDYALCFTAPESALIHLPKESVCIGEITASADFLLEFQDGNVKKITPNGYQHF